MKKRINMKKLLQILLAFLLTIQNNCFLQVKAEDDEFWNDHVQSIKKDFDDSFEYEKNQTINILASEKFVTR